MTYDPNNPGGASPETHPHLYAGQEQNMQQYQQPQGQQPMQQPPQQGQYQQPQGQQPMPIDPNSIPEHLRGGQPVQNNLDAGAGGGGPRLSIKGKQFAFINGDEVRYHPLGMPLNVIIITSDPHTGTAKKFFEQSFVEGVDQSPACYSSDGITPDSGSERPQSASCANCPHNKFGTARSQDGTMGKGKACKDFKRVYVVPADQPWADVYELHVPVTSHRNMQDYGGQLAKHGLNTYAAITQMNFSNDTSPVLTFSLVGYVDAQSYAKVQERMQSGEVEKLLPSLSKSPADPSAVVHGQPAVEGPAQPSQQALPPGQGVSQQDMAPPPQQPQGQVQAPPTPPPAQPTPPPQPQTPPPCPLGAPPGFKMTNPAGASYQQFVSGGWTDQMMIDNGHMQQVG